MGETSRELVKTVGFLVKIVGLRVFRRSLIVKTPWLICFQNTIILKRCEWIFVNKYYWEEAEPCWEDTAYRSEEAAPRWEKSANCYEEPRAR